MMERNEVMNINYVPSEKCDALMDYNPIFTSV